jgi:DNA polymerase delta subunit 1
VSRVDPGETKPFIRNVFTLNTCAHIVGSQVLEFKDERKLLAAWTDFVQKVDPDLVIGYNIANFDLPYLLDRAKALKVSDFAFLGRMRRECQLI